MPTKSMVSLIAAGLLVLGAVLAALNWVAQPERATTWGASLVLLAVMTTVVFGRRGGRRPAPATNGAARHRLHGVIFATLMLVAALAVPLARNAGAIVDAAGLSERLTMTLAGAYVVMLGNGVPKTLTSLAPDRDTAARAQAARRLAGWALVLAGLVCVVSWLVLPSEVAKPLSLTVLAGSTIVVAARCAASCRTRRRAV